MESNCTDMDKTDFFLLIFESIYTKVHSPLCMGICAIGLVSNIINAIVLTRSNMKSPINMVLTSLSVAELLLISMFVVHTIYDMAEASCNVGVRRYWPALIKLIAINLSVVCHTVAIWHTVLIGLIRFVAIKFPGRSRSLVTNQLVIRCVTLNYIVVPIVGIPIFFTTVLQRAPTDELMKVCPRSHSDNNEILYYLDFGLSWRPVAMWIMSFVFKIIPCLMVIALTAALLRSMSDQAKKRQYLVSINNQFRPRSGKMITDRRPDIRKERQRDHQKRVAVMLAVITGLMCLIELPHGILLVLVNVIPCFAHTVYNRLGDFINMLSLFYSSVNFILYCIMNTEFRRTFCRLFLLPISGTTTREAISRKRYGDREEMQVTKYLLRKRSRDTRTQLVTIAVTNPNVHQFFPSTSTSNQIQMVVVPTVDILEPTDVPTSLRSPI